MRDDQLDRALLLARAGVELDDTVRTQGNLLGALLRSPAAIGVVRGDGWPLYSVAVSPDERLMAIGDERGTVTVYDGATRRPMGQYRFAAASSSPAALLARRVDARRSQSGSPQRPGGTCGPHRSAHAAAAVADRPARFPATNYIVAELAFLPNGRDLAIEQIHNAPTRMGRRRCCAGSTDDRRRRGAGPSGGQTLSDQLVHDRGSPAPVHDQPEGRHHNDRPARLRRLQRWPVGDLSGSVSPDGRLFALGSPRGEVRVLDLRSGRSRPFRGRQSGPVRRLAFTPDRRTLVTSHDDGDVLVWDVARGELVRRSRATSGAALGLEISADGRTLYSAGDDERALVWDLAGDRRLVRPFDAGPPFVAADDRSPHGLAISPDGRTVAVAQTDGTVDLIDAQTLERPRRRARWTGFAAAVVFSPDGQLLAIAGEGGQVTLWDARTLRPRAT